MPTKSSAAASATGRRQKDALAGPLPAPPFQRLKETRQRKAQRTGDHEAGQDRRLGPELQRCRPQQQHGQDGHHQPEDNPRQRPLGNGPGSGIMNSPKTSSSGDVTRTCQRSRPHMGATCQLATMQWSGDQRHGQGGESGEAGHESQFQSQQPELPPDQQTSDDQHGVGDDQPAPHRDPPEILWLGETRAERDEGDDQSQVRRIEDVTALPANQVFRRHRDRRPHRRRSRSRAGSTNGRAAFPGCAG